MSGGITDEKSAWVTRVLGVALPGAKAGAGLDWKSVRAAYDAATETVDTQISALQSALKKTDNDVLHEIAEFGMNGITGNHKVRLMAAMMEIGSGDATALQKIGPKVLKIAQDFRQHLDSDERVMACDENPFGVAVSIRQTLGGALGQMADSLSRGLKP